MAFALRYLVVFLLLSMVTQGLSRCDFGSIQIWTERTGRIIQGDPEWKVTVINTCDCIQKLVRLSCEGFIPDEPVEPGKLRSLGDGSCLLYRGQALLAKGNIVFTYVGMPYIFKPISSRVDPSCQQ